MVLASKPGRQDGPPNVCTALSTSAPGCAVRWLRTLGDTLMSQEDLSPPKKASGSPPTKARDNAAFEPGTAECAELVPSSGPECREPSPRPPALAAATMTTQQMQTEQTGPFKMTVWEEENFQGKRCEFTDECGNIMERGFCKIRSVKVENGAFVAFEHPEFQGQQFILEKGDYPRHEAWSGNSGYRTEHLLSFRPIKCARKSPIQFPDSPLKGPAANPLQLRNILPSENVPTANVQAPRSCSQKHGDSKVTLHECEDLAGRTFEICDDYPSLQAMGWCSKEVPSMKVNNGAWVAYQFPGYRGYQYILERDRHEGEYRNYTEYSTQAHSNQVQSIRRVQH
ncbi:beta-crystallin A2-like [Scleropages formosus]|uniref:Beta-crystallin A2 n=1 Tax=Scleropages formosus TaxID=113540 RepID=A0A0P7WP20_SCLFO|nr:beta-crystallin A2-like [Scleropages formosus]